MMRPSFKHVLQVSSFVLKCEVSGPGSWKHWGILSDVGNNERMGNYMLNS